MGLSHLRLNKTMCLVHYLTCQQRLTPGIYLIVITYQMIMNVEDWTWLPVQWTRHRALMPVFLFWRPLRHDLTCTRRFQQLSDRLSVFFFLLKSLTSPAAHGKKIIYNIRHQRWDTNLNFLLSETEEKKPHKACCPASKWRYLSTKIPELPEDRKYFERKIYLSWLEYLGNYLSRDGSLDWWK